MERIDLNGRFLSPLIVCLIIFFPVFGLEITDTSGHIKPPSVTTTRILQMLWLSVASSALLALLFANRLALVNTLRDNKLYLVLLAIAAIQGLSVLVNTPTSAVAWYRAIEFSVFISLIILAADYCFRLPQHEDVPYLAIFYGALFAQSVALIGIVFFPDHAVTHISKRVQTAGHIYHPIVFGGILYIGLLAAHYLYVRRRISGIVLSISTLVTCFFIGLTLARSAILLAVLINLALILLYLLSARKKTSLLCLACILVVLGSTFMQANRLVLPEPAASASIPKPPASLENALAVFTSDLGGMNSRDSLYAHISKGIVDNPFTGVGYITGVRDYIRPAYTNDVWVPWDSHNAVLETLVSVGIPGAIPLLGFMLGGFLLASICLMSPKSDHSTRIICLLIGSVIAGSIIYSPFGNKIYFAGAVLYLVILHLWAIQRRKTGSASAKTHS